jgi:hypothetical protein
VTEFVAHVEAVTANADVLRPRWFRASPLKLRLKQEILDRELDRVYEAKTLRGEVAEP